jgi:hypothetical protein
MEGYLEVLGVYGRVILKWVVAQFNLATDWTKGVRSPAEAKDFFL